jgi:hypothetical protein
MEQYTETIRIREAELEHLGIPFRLLDRCGPQCGSAAIVVADLHESVEPSNFDTVEHIELSLSRG